jgi:hypothetical protein
VALIMASPWRDATSGAFYLRVRVPADLRSVVRGQTISVPVGTDIVEAKVGEMVKVSLCTRDPQQAKARFTSALAALKTARAASATRKPLH